MLSVDGDADAVVEARIRIGWNKFRQLVPLLTNKDVSLSASRDENGQVDVTCGVKLKDRLPSKELRERD